MFIPPLAAFDPSQIPNLSEVCILLPAIVSRWTNNATPWNLAMQAYPLRVLLVRRSFVSSELKHG